jgi:hypothetical protein
MFSISAAQTIQFGVNVGADGINMTNTNNGLYQSKTLTGQTKNANNLMELRGGVFADVNFNWFTIRPGLSFVTRGGKNEFFYVNSPGTPFVYHATEELTLNYLEIPVDFLVRIPIDDEGKLFFGGGPFVDIGLSAKDKNTVLYTYVTSNTENRNDYSPKFGADIKNPGYGINTLLGFNFNNGLFFSVGYSWGLNNISTNSTADAKLRAFSISAGYCF